MPTEKIKFGVCSDYIRLLLMDKAKHEERVYPISTTKYIVADIVLDLLSNYVNIYNKAYTYIKVDKNDFTKAVVFFSISEKLFAYREMRIIDALEIIMNRENTINRDFLNYVIYAIEKWIENLRSKVSKSKYEELIRLNKKISCLNYDVEFQVEYLLKFYQAQIKIKQS